MEMKTQVHHVVPRSRGGTDEYVEVKSEYDHAYDHAVDFLVFDKAPVFDCRHVAWPLLPEDLQIAVRNKLREVWNSRQSWKGQLGGAAARDKQVGVCAEGFGSVVSENMRNLVEKEEHWFQTPEHSERVTNSNLRLFAEGNHPLQQPGVCSICGQKLKTKSGLGPHMRKHRNEN
jgi:hypothetical protein